MSLGPAHPGVPSAHPRPAVKPPGEGPLWSAPDPGKKLWLITAELAMMFTPQVLSPSSSSKLWQWRGAGEGTRAGRGAGRLWGRAGKTHLSPQLVPQLFLMAQKGVAEPGGKVNGGRGCELPAQPGPTSTFTV